MMMALTLTSCYKEDISRNRQATMPGQQAYRYVKTANEPLTDMLFMARLSHEYFKLTTDDERKVFWEKRFLPVVVKDVSEAGGVRKWTLQNRRSDYDFETFVFSETTAGQLSAEMLMARGSDRYLTKYNLKADVSDDKHWALSDYTFAVSEDIASWADEINVFDGGAKQMDATWGVDENDKLYCELTGTIKMASHETPALDIEANFKEPLRAVTVFDKQMPYQFAWAKGRLKLRVTDGGTKETDEVGVVLSGNLDGRVLIEMNHLTEEWSVMVRRY